MDDGMNSFFEKGTKEAVTLKEARKFLETCLVLDFCAGMDGLLCSPQGMTRVVQEP